MNRSLLLSLTMFLIICVNKPLTAQPDKIWTFGKNSGLDFSTVPPAYIETSNISIEGCAAICNEEGGLLFYSDGSTVWNRFHEVMPNGDGILGNDMSILGVPGSAAQGVTIVPSPADPNQYYLFVLNAAESMFSDDGYLRYSIIDMTLNGGNGDVITESKNIIIGNKFGEKVTSARGAGCYYWIIAHRYDSAAFYVYKIDETGIHAPLVQESLFIDDHSSGIIDYGAGSIKMNHGMTRIAMQTNFQNCIQIAQFDNSTGIISGNILIDSLPLNSRFGGLAFSPDNSKLYSYKYQYDISLFPDIEAINSSRIQIIPNSTGQQILQIRNAVDGKIYFTQEIYNSIGVIHDPNLSGLACDLEHDYITIPSWAYFETSITSSPGMGLGNDIFVNSGNDTQVNAPHIVTLCPEEIYGYQLSVSDEYDNYFWNNGEESFSIEISEGGIYWVISSGTCKTSVDSFYVNVIPIEIEIIGDSILCEGAYVFLNLSNTYADSYIWNDGSTDTFLIVEEPGTYYVTAFLDGCEITDTIIIYAIDPYGYIDQKDTTICMGDIIKIRAVSHPLPATYLWNTGMSTNHLSIDGQGQYYVTIENQCGVFTDSVNINTMNCDCHILSPTAFSPNGDNINDGFKLLIECEQLSSYNFFIINRFGEVIFSSENPNEGWDGTYKGLPCDVGTYYYYAEINSFNQKIVRKGDILLLR